MGRSSTLKVTAFAGALCALAGVAGCVDDGASLHVVCPIAPEVEEDACRFDPEGGECVFKGEMNLAGAAEYVSALSVESGLIPRASDVPPRTEPNRLSMTGGTVELRKPNGSRLEIPGLDNPYHFTGSGTVPPGGRGVMSVTLIPKRYADRLRENVLGSDPLDEVVIAVHVEGVTDGNKDVESGEWQWPVKLLYESPVSGKGQCFEMDYCPSLGGQDGFANACLCLSGDENSCQL